MRGRVLIGLVAVALLLIGFGYWQHRRADQAEVQLGLDASRMLNATFEKASVLKVGRLSGTVVARSETTSGGGLIRNTQITRAPATVDYVVDLGAIDPSDYRWNADAKIMTVTLPPVRASAPNIDLSRAQVRQSGLWISRSAGLAMQTQAAVRLRDRAAYQAGREENLGRARENARAAVRRLVAAPLAAAGLGEVQVFVRLPGEDRPAGLSKERWDVSKSLQEIYNDAT